VPSDHACTPPPPAGHEPEIVFLGKVVHVGLLVFRGATMLAALLGIAYGVSQMLGFGPSAADGGVKTAPTIAPHFVWFCIGIPPLVSIRWLFGRGRWLMLALGIALWIGPNFLESDSDYGYIIRFFASLVALSVLFVWRTVFDLCLRAKSGNNPT
jgi:ABC-type amino acid transport system permease subunit